MIRGVVSATIVCYLAVVWQCSVKLGASVACYATVVPLYSTKKLSTKESISR